LAESPPKHQAMRLRGGKGGGFEPVRFSGGEGEGEIRSGGGEGDDGGVVQPGRRIAPIEGSNHGLVNWWDGEATHNQMLNMPITSDQAAELRARGIIKGRWCAESEEEPTSDLEDAQNVGLWPDEWVGHPPEMQQL